MFFFAGLQARVSTVRSGGPPCRRPATRSTWRKLERVERRRTGRSASAFKKNTKHTLTVTVGEGVVNRMHLAAVLEALRVGEQMRRVLVLMSRYAACWRVDTCSACIH